MSSAPASEAVAATAALLFSPASVAALLVALAFAYVVLEQLSFGATAPQLPSPAGWFVPVIGSIVAMVRDPYTYWEAQRRLAPAGVSKFYLLGKTVFFSTDTDTSRRILMHNGPDSLQMVREGVWLERARVPLPEGEGAPPPSLSPAWPARAGPRGRRAAAAP